MTNTSTRIAALAETREIDSAIVTETLGLHPTNARWRLAEMAQRGVLRRVARGRYAKPSAALPVAVPDYSAPVQMQAADTFIRAPSLARLMAGR